MLLHRTHDDLGADHDDRISNGGMRPCEQLMVRPKGGRDR